MSDLYGLQVIGSDNAVQIDSEFSNYQIIAKGSGLAQAPQTTGYQGILISHEPSVEPGLLFLRSPAAVNNIVSQVSIVKTGAFYTGFRIWSRYDNTPFEYAIAARVPVAASSGWGMQVRQTNTAKLQYDSAAPFLKITGLIPIARNAWQDYVFPVYSHPFTQNPYYCLQGATPFASWGGSNEAVYYGVCSSGQSAVEFKWFTLIFAGVVADSNNNYGAFNPGYDNWGLQYVIVADID